MRYIYYGLSALLLLIAIPAVYAQDQDPEINPPRLHLAPITTQTVGDPVTISVLLENALGRQLPNKVLVVYVNGERVRRARTDDNGRVDIGLGNDLDIGTHDIVVEFIGTEDYQQVTTRGSFTVRPLDFTIQTVPPLENVEFVIDGTTVSTDENGRCGLYSAV